MRTFAAPENQNRQPEESGRSRPRPSTFQGASGEMVDSEPYHIHVATSRMSASVWLGQGS
ncbi:hypothetical protein N9E48_01470 [Paracoccaceae bacterium]|nr:hypothetical protein [Paracoccaceae bacterium]